MALRLRWPWLQRVHQTCSWNALPDGGEGPVLDLFRAATALVVGDGESTLFWTDNWIKGSSIRTLAPAVLAAVPRHK